MHTSSKLLPLAAAAAATLGACQHDSKRLATVDPKPLAPKLELTNRVTAKTVILDTHAINDTRPLTADEKKVEEAVVASCSPTGPEAIPAAILLFLIGKGVDFAVNYIDERLQEELKNYTATYEAATGTALYRTGSLTMDHTCFRLTRFYNREKVAGVPDKTNAVAMDFVGRLHIEGSNRLVLTPLRIFYENFVPKTSDEKYGVTINLKMNTTWREGNRGRSEAPSFDLRLLEETIAMKEKIKDKDGKDTDRIRPYHYRGYLDLQHKDLAPDKKVPATVSAPAAPPQVVAPLPPWSTYEGTPHGSNWTVVTLSVAEAGNVSWLLKNAASLFHDNKDKIVEQVEDALKKAAGLQ